MNLSSARIISLTHLKEMMIPPVEHGTTPSSSFCPVSALLWGSAIFGDFHTFAIGMGVVRVNNVTYIYLNNCYRCIFDSVCDIPDFYGTTCLPL